MTPMADIFISYAREDRRRAGALVEVLTRHGWSVWWDKDLRHGQDFGESIQEQLNAARCVVVLWSASSLRSAHVLEEAEEGRANGRLVPALIEAVPLPLGFRRLQAADLTDWTGTAEHEEFTQFERSIAALLDDAPRAAAVERPMPRRETGNRRMAAIAAAAALIIAIAGGGIYLLSGDSAGNAVPSNPPKPVGTTPERPTTPAPKPVPEVVSDPSASPPRATDPTTRPSVSSTPVPSKPKTPASEVSNQPPGNPPTGRNESGCQSLEDSVRARPEVHAAQFKLGRCYYDASRFDEAIAAISRAVDLNSRVPEYLQVRGLAKWKNGLGRQGLSDLDSAVSLDVMNATLYKSRGEIHAGVGDYQRAVDDFRKATELAPQDSGAWFGLADALTRNGDREAAEVAMRQAKSRQ